MLERWHALSRTRQWIAAIGVLFSVFVIIAAASNASTSSPSSSSTSGVAADVEKIIDDAVEDSGAGSYLSSGQENALGSAESYLRSSNFSRKGLIEQLKFEGYSHADAMYAVDNVTVDWNEQAAGSARSYLRSSSFSRSALVEQLVFEGYTRSQAEYGVSVAY
jgi:hypothetical protein